MIIIRPPPVCQWAGIERRQNRKTEKRYGQGGEKNRLLRRNNVSGSNISWLKERLIKANREAVLLENKEISLDRLPIGTRASVTSIRSDGALRRRMLDLGVISGTEIEPLYTSPSGNPVAYLIRGAVIALRSDVSSKIMVSA